MKAAVRQLLFGSSAWTPAGLFRSGAQGAWYDPSNLGSMYQDTSGTTPVTAVGQPVGLRLDTRLGLVRGSQLISGISSAGSIGTGTGTDDGTTIVLNGTDASNRGRRYWQLNGLTVNGTYEISFTVSAIASGGVMPTWSTSAALTATGAFTGLAAPGTSSAKLVATATTMYFSVQTVSTGGSGISVPVSGVSIREIPGNHATQSTSTSRPTLQQDAGGRYYGSLDGVDDSVASATGGGGTAGFFFCAAIQVGGGAGTIRTLWMDRSGVAGGYQVRINASNQLEFTAGNGTVVSGISTVGTLPVGETHVVTAWDDGVNFKGQIDGGAVTSAARPAVLAGTAGFTIGKNNSAATEFFPGRDYGMVYRKDSAPTPTEIARTQRYLAARAGIAL